MTSIMRFALWERSRSLSHQFMKSPRHVTLDGAAIIEVAAKIEELPPAEPYGLPIISSRPLTEGEMIVYELMSCAVNYCYWYGLPSIRPNGASANRMYELLDQTFDAWVEEKQPYFLGRPNLSGKEIGRAHV